MKDCCPTTHTHLYIYIWCELQLANRLFKSDETSTYTAGLNSKPLPLS